jgi:protein ImuA
MARGAVARETVFALRRQIARIEGTLPERLEAPVGTAATVVRRGSVAGSNGRVLTGVDRLDAALGGGLPRAALTEIHGAETRDAGAASGFVLALASRLLALRGPAEATAPVLWIGTAEIFGETGFPYARGLQAMFGIEPETLLFCEAGKLTDALWVAEEAARLKEPAAVVIEVRGNPRQLDLTATRRLHSRTRVAGRPLFLLRQAATPEPTAAPVRLVVEPASSALRETVGGPLAGSIGRPAFTVAISKGSVARSESFTLEWNPDERTFKERWGQERRAKDTLPVVSLPRHGADIAATPGEVVAFRPADGKRADEWPIDGWPAGKRVEGWPAAGGQLSRQERTAHRRPRRAG